MKKISYGVQLGLVGSINSGKELLLDFLKKNSIESYISDQISEYLYIFKEIPIKFRIFSEKGLNDVIVKYDLIERLDVLILSLNLHDMNSIYQYKKKDLDELCEYLNFQGISVLAGIEKASSSQYRISKVQLVNKAKELNFLYCFEIKDEEGDLIGLFNHVLDDLLFKFKFSRPELFEQAKLYGNELLKQ